MISYEPFFRTMKEKNLSGNRLDQMGLSRATYSALQHGKNITINTLDRLCEMLDCRVEDVIVYVKEEKEGTDR